MKTDVKEACALGAELSLYAVTAPSSAIAAEHRAVDVSISMILCIVYRIRFDMFGNKVPAVDSIIGKMADSVNNALFMSASIYALFRKQNMT
jgi:hypothetical protein